MEVLQAEGETVFVVGELVERQVGKRVDVAGKIVERHEALQANGETVYVAGEVVKGQEELEAEGETIRVIGNAVLVALLRSCRIVSAIGDRAQGFLFTLLTPEVVEFRP